MPDTLRVGLVGCRGIAGAHVNGYLHQEVPAELAAVCDIERAHAAKRAEQAKLGESAIYTDIDQMLTQPDIEAVDLCLPHHLHAPFALKALEAGKHVLVEKPLTVTTAEARQVVEKADEKGLVAMVAQTQRYEPSYRGLAKLIADGDLGEIHAIRFDGMQNLAAIRGPDDWLFDGARAGGGIVISVLVHRIDLSRMLVGDVKRVMAMTQMRHPLMHNGAEDFAVALMEYENGALGECFATYSGYRMPYSEMLMIFGSKGAVHALPPLGHGRGPAYACCDRVHAPEPEGSWNRQFDGFVPVEPDRSGLPSDDGFVNEIAHWAHCIRTGAEPNSSARDNFGTVAVICAIYDSARSGEPVEVEQL